MPHVELLDCTSSSFPLFFCSGLTSRTASGPEILTERKRTVKERLQRFVDCWARTSEEAVHQAG